MLYQASGDSASCLEQRWVSKFRRGLHGRVKRAGFTHVAVGENQGMVFPRVMPTAAAAVDEGGEYGAGMKKKGSSKKLLRMFKAILFETSLVLCLIFFFSCNFVVFHY